MKSRSVVGIFTAAARQHNVSAFSYFLHHSKFTSLSVGSTILNQRSVHHSPEVLRMSAGKEPSAPACVPGGKCLPCESLDKSHLLSSEQIDSELTGLKLWNLSDDKTKITRTYTAKNFQAAMDSLNEIGKIAERENHHPDMHLTGYRNVEIALFTHSLGGISINDIAMAKMIDEEVAIVYSPKWLRENPDAKKE